MEKSTLDWSHFGENLKKYRTESKMTQKELGIRLGQVDERSAQSRIAKIENGTIIPNSTELINILDLLNVSIDALLGRTPINSSKDKFSPRAICEFISNFIGKNLNVKMTTIERNEDCWSIDENDIYSTIHEKKLNKYNAIYFSNWYPIPNYHDSEEDYIVFDQCGNSCRSSLFH